MANENSGGFFNQEQDTSGDGVTTFFPDAGPDVPTTTPEGDTTASFFAQTTDTDHIAILNQGGTAVLNSELTGADIRNLIGAASSDASDLSNVAISISNGNVVISADTSAGAIRTALDAASVNEIAGNRLQHLVANLSASEQAIIQTKIGIDSSVTITIDPTPTANSDNPVASGGVFSALEGKLDSIPIDSAPTDNSTHLVTSGGTKVALDAKQDELDFDSTPTSASQNPVTSTGIHGALAGKQDNLTGISDVPGLDAALQGKQDNLTFDTVPTDGSNNPVTSEGIRTAIDAVTVGTEVRGVDRNDADTTISITSTGGNRAATQDYVDAQITNVEPDSVAGVDGSGNPIQIAGDSTGQNVATTKGYVDAQIQALDDEMIAGADTDGTDIPIGPDSTGEARAATVGYVDFQGQSKANTDLSNVDSDLSDLEKVAVRNKIGAIDLNDFNSLTVPTQYANPQRDTDFASKIYSDTSAGTIAQGLIDQAQLGGTPIQLFGQFANFDAAENSRLSLGDVTYNTATDTFTGIVLSDNVGSWHIQGITGDNFTLVGTAEDSTTPIRFNVLSAGAQGPQGNVGPKGDPGANGAPGAAGAPGSDGDDAPFLVYLWTQVPTDTAAPTPAATYNGTTFGNLGDYVSTFPGVTTGMDTYQTFAEYNPNTETLGNWATPYEVSAIGPPGPAGPTGASSFVGYYNNLTTYDAGDIVIASNLDGEMFRSLVDNNTGNALTSASHWMPVGGSGDTTIYSSSSPAGPEAFQRWVDTDSSFQYIWIEGENANYWVQISGIGQAGSGSSGGGSVNSYADLGAIPLIYLPTVTADNNDQILKVEDGAWALGEDGGGSTSQVISLSDNWTVRSVNSVFSFINNGTTLMTLDATGNLVVEGDITSASSLNNIPTNANSYAFDNNWTLTGSAAGLGFSNSGTTAMRLDSSGNLVLTGDITSNLDVI